MAIDHPNTVGGVSLADPAAQPDPGPRAQPSHRGFWLLIAAGLVVALSCAFIVVAPNMTLSALELLGDGGQTGQVDPCDQGFLKANYPDSSESLLFLCDEVGDKKKLMRHAGDAMELRYYFLQILTLAFSAIATVLVAMKDTFDHLARFAIIPTAIVTLLTGLSSLYGLPQKLPESHRSGDRSCRPRRRHGARPDQERRRPEPGE